MQPIISLIIILLGVLLLVQAFDVFDSATQNNSTDMILGAFLVIVGGWLLMRPSGSSGLTSGGLDMKAEKWMKKKTTVEEEEKTNDGDDNGNKQTVKKRKTVEEEETKED